MRKLTTQERRAAREILCISDEQVDEVIADLTSALPLGADRERPQPVTYRAVVPERWRRKSEILLDQYRDMKLEVLQAFGRQQPFVLAELDHVLSDFAAQTVGARGVLTGIQYPLGAGGIGNVVFTHVDPPQYPTGIIEDETAWPLAYASWRTAQPLSHLRIMAKRLGRDTGLDLAGAVAYLLTDEQVVLPWLSIAERQGALGPRFTIAIGSVDVSAEDVRDAYSERRRTVTRSPSYKPIEADTLALVHFVQERLPETGRIPWTAIWRAWGETAEVNRGARTKYSSWRSLKNVYESAIVRMSEGSKNA